jgi:hypothetical protein
VAVLGNSPLDTRPSRPLPLLHERLTGFNLSSRAEGRRLPFLAKMGVQPPGFRGRVGPEKLDDPMHFRSGSNTSQAPPSLATTLIIATLITAASFRVCICAQLFIKDARNDSWLLRQPMMSLVLSASLSVQGRLGDTWKFSRLRHGQARAASQANASSHL